MKSQYSNNIVLKTNFRRLVIMAWFTLLLSATIILALCSIPVHAAKKKVNVITNITITNSLSSQTEPTISKYSFTYTKDGFVKKRKTKSDGWYTSTTTYSYKNNKLIKARNRYSENGKKYKPGGTGTFTYKKGKLLKYVETDEDVKMIHKLTCDKKGRIIKDTIYKQILNKTSKSYVTKFRYDNKGRVIRQTQLNRDKAVVWTKGNKRITKYKYDQKGNPVRIDYIGGDLDGCYLIYSNIYQNGLMVKSTYEMYNSKKDVVLSYQSEYRYKQLKVPSSKIKKIKRQQRALIQDWSDMFLH